MNCIKLLLNYLNYKLNMRIKKIEIEKLKNVRLIRSRLQVYKIVTGILVCYRFPRSYRMVCQMVGQYLGGLVGGCCGYVRLHCTVAYLYSRVMQVALCYYFSSCLVFNFHDDQDVVSPLHINFAECILLISPKQQGKYILCPRQVSIPSALSLISYILPA